MKQLVSKRTTAHRHWVGDGFPVRSIFSYDRGAEELSPFLLLDYAGPARFTPTEQRRGVGEHPHRGFETVTIVYSGEVEHRDSVGGGGLIGPGDVQWMTAGSGIVHDEFHGADFAKTGGAFELVQLWVNLAAKDKMTAPGYQSLVSSAIPSVALDNEAGFLRVIAGHFGAHAGPAQTHSPMDLFDLRVHAGKRVEFTLPAGHTALMFVMKGEIVIGEEAVKEAELGVLERAGDHVAFFASTDATLLVLSGQPLDEPVVGYGPFVMNSHAEIQQAFTDYQRGLMGHVAQSVAD